MTQRTCPSCGAHVALLDDRCRTCGADPDLQLVELGVGGSRPPPATGPHRTGRGWRPWASALAVVAAVWGVLVVTGGGGQDEAVDPRGRTTTTALLGHARSPVTRPAPTTTTTEVLAGAPLLGEPSGLRLVWWVGRTGRVVDLDTGAVTPLRVQVLGITQGGLLVDDVGDIEVWPPPYDGSTAVTIATGYDEFDQVMVTDGGTLVWYLSSVYGTAGPMPVTAVLLDLSGQPQAQFTMPDQTWAVGAVARGLVVTAPGGVYVLDRAGAAERVATGTVLGTTDDRIYTYVCDEHLACGVEVVDDQGRTLERPALVSGSGGWLVPGPAGHVASVVTPAAFGDPSQVYLDGVQVMEVAFDGSTGAQSMAWTPDGRWLVVALSDGVHFIDTRDGGPHVVVDVGLASQQGSVIAFAAEGR